MRCAVWVVALVCGVFAASLPVYVSATGVDAPPPDPPLRTGDVVLRHGNGLWSRLFAQLNRHDQRFSHAGIVILDEQHQWRVVHAEVDDRLGHGSVRLDAWSDFVDKVPRIALLRVHDDGVAERLAEAALAMHRQALEFDLTFDLSRPDAVYCTELVWRALTVATGRDPLPVKPQVNGREVILIETLLHDIANLTLIHMTD